MRSPATWNVVPTGASSSEPHRISTYAPPDAAPHWFVGCVVDVEEPVQWPPGNNFKDRPAPLHDVAITEPPPVTVRHWFTGSVTVWHPSAHLEPEHCFCEKVVAARVDGLDLPLKHG